MNTTEAIETLQCPSCRGTGEWEAECCNGSGGCSCRGERVPMGRCNVCYGTGRVPADISKEQLMANCRAIRGLHFLGSGPNDMYSVWPNRGHFVQRTAL